MRNSLLLLSIAGVIAACSEQQQPTSPGTGAPAAPPSAGVSSTTLVATANGKPTDQVGFTKLFTVAGATVNIKSISGPKTATATCPAGSYAVGGGYEIAAFGQAMYFVHTKSGLNDANGWSVTGYTIDALTDLNIYTTVTCIQ